MKEWKKPMFTVLPKSELYKYIQVAAISILCPNMDVR